MVVVVVMSSSFWVESGVWQEAAVVSLVCLRAPMVVLCARTRMSCPVLSCPVLSPLLLSSHPLADERDKRAAQKALEKR